MAEEVVEQHSVVVGYFHQPTTKAEGLVPVVRCSKAPVCFEDEVDSMAVANSRPEEHSTVLLAVGAACCLPTVLLAVGAACCLPTVLVLELRGSIAVDDQHHRCR